jgi:phosphonate transport system substrate-binding protein
MWSRRLVLSALAVALLAAPAQAADWRKKHPEIVFSVVPSENAAGVVNRYEPFMQHLSRELGVKVTLRIANDYAAVIEAMRAGEVHVAHFGPSAYARAWLVTGGDVEPFATARNSAGVVGYYSVLYVRAGDSAQSVHDLKGRNICLVDPNSASGNNVPRFTLDKMGIDPEAFFGKLVYAGSHENAVTALLQGTCDGAFNWWNTEKESMLMRMAAKGMVKPEDVRIVLKSDMIPGSPTTLKRSLPEDMKADIKRAFLEAPEKGSEAWLRISDGNATGYAEVTHDDYKVMIELNTFVDRLRRKSS